jgi:hypothetical protein
MCFGRLKHRFQHEDGNVIAESENLGVRGIAGIHDRCMGFALRYDEACGDLLGSIGAAAVEQVR